MKKHVASSDYSATRFASPKWQRRLHHERRTMVQTGTELTADERADQLQYHDRLATHEPPARGLSRYLMGRSALPAPLP